MLDPDTEAILDDAEPVQEDKERARLEALASYDIMYSPVEADYDAVTSLLCELTGADFAMINFIDAECLWAKSAQGIPPTHVMRRESVCDLVLADNDDMLHILDLKRDARTHALSIAREVTSYVGIPLRAHNGERIGVLAMGFAQAKTLAAREQKALVTLRRQIEVLLERRRALNMIRHQQHAIQRLVEQHDLLLHTVSRDTRNLLAGILSNCEFAINLFDERSEEAREAIEDALSAAHHAKQMLRHLDDSKKRFRQNTPLKTRSMLGAP